MRERLHILYERNPLFQPTISGLCAMLPVQNATYFFFLFPPISLKHSACVCMGVYRSFH